MQGAGTNKDSRLDRVTVSTLGANNHESGGEVVTKKFVFSAVGTFLASASPRGGRREPRPFERNLVHL
jgi:hypothetical protein